MKIFATMPRQKNGFVRQFAADTSGSELVEFALCTSVLLMVMFGVIDGSRVVYVHHFVAQAAAAGARYASTRGSAWTSGCASTNAADCVASAANISSFVMQTATVGISPGNLTAVPSWSGNTPAGVACSSSNIVNAPGCMVSVQVSYVFQFTLPFLPHLTIPMSSSASGVIQNRT